MGSTSLPYDPTAYDPHSLRNGKLFEPELLWRDHYEFLKDHGYTLRPRYHPDWMGSWLNSSSKEWTDCEDGVAIAHYQVLDATRAGGSLVILKQTDVSVFPNEIIVGKHFAAEPLASDPKNHCVPVLDIIYPREGSNIAFMVMPLLYDTEFAPFQTVGEVVELFRQIFEGLQFMHKNNVLHGDCKWNNIMADTLSLFDFTPHPCDPWMKLDFSGRTSKPASRTSRPVKYYLIDFDLSHIYRPEDAPYLKKPGWGGDKTVPEFLIPQAPPCDPFPVDVYCIGNAFRRHFLDGWENRVKAKKGFEFMRELVSDMVNNDPKKRPTMNEVVSRFDDIIKGLSMWKLRSPVVDADASLGVFGSVAHWSKQLRYIALRLPAIPRP